MKKAVVRILAVGDELLLGAKRDGNSAWLAAALLRERGLAADRIEICGDGEAALRAALARLAAGADAVVATGGLGTTEDDRTRDALAALAGVPLVEDPDARRALEARLAERGIPWRGIYARQALVPLGFAALPNPVGQAAGIAGAIGGTLVFALPGVPAEMRAMFAAAVLPRLPAGEEAAVRVVTAAGEPEAVLGERLQALMAAPEPLVGITVQQGVATVRILARGPGAEARAEAAAREAEARLGPALAGRGELSLAQVVVRSLLAAGVTVATAESCTGGGLAAALVAVPGVSAVFRGGFVAYADEVKAAWLGVDPAVLRAQGAVSAAVAAALARGAAARGGSRMGVGITGIAGPAGGTAAKPVGTVHLAVVLDGREAGVSRRFQGDRAEVQEAAGREALRGMRALLLGLPWGDDPAGGGESRGGPA